MVPEKPALTAKLSLNNSRVHRKCDFEICRTSFGLPPLVILVNDRTERFFFVPHFKLGHQKYRSLSRSDFLYQLHNLRKCEYYGLKN